MEFKPIKLSEEEKEFIKYRKINEKVLQKYIEKQMMQLGISQSEMFRKEYCNTPINEEE